MKVAAFVFAGAMLAAGGALAQGAPVAGGVAGAAAGAAVGGPVGAVVGGVVGATAGGIAENDRPRFRTYVEGRHYPSYKWGGDVRVGTVLPESGVTYYEVPSEYHADRYRYTVVNGRTVLVDPGSRRIVEVIE